MDSRDTTEVVAKKKRRFLGLFALPFSTVFQQGGKVVVLPESSMREVCTAA